MFKKLKVMGLSLVLAVGVFGCSKTDTKVEKVEDDFSVCLILSEGGVNDESFNQSAYEGGLKAKEEFGIELSYLESKSTSDFMQNIETAIDKEADLIIGVGFQIAEDIEEAALAYPEQKFVIIDSTYEEIPSNVRPITFNEEQAGYLTGLIAAKTTKTNVIGWIGGLDIPSCSNFYIGYENGAKEVNPDIKVLKQFTNSFTDAAKGRVAAEGMVKEGSDVIFMASGGGNAGVLEVVKENDIKAIGVDMPNNYLAPEYVLTSALKNVGEGLKLTIKDALEGDEQFNGGNEVKYDLTNGGVGFEKTDLLSEELIKYVEDKINN